MHIIITTALHHLYTCRYSCSEVRPSLCWANWSAVLKWPNQLRRHFRETCMGWAKETTITRAQIHPWKRKKKSFVWDKMGTECTDRYNHKGGWCAAMIHLFLPNYFGHLPSSALTLLVGHQEEHLAGKNWVMRCRCGYLSGARCRLFAYGLADTTAIPIISCLI